MKGLSSQFRFAALRWAARARRAVVFLSRRPAGAQAAPAAALEDRPSPSSQAAAASPAGRRGQALIEYLLMTVMLLFLFTGLYRVLQGRLKELFAKAGTAILRAYY